MKLIFELTTPERVVEKKEVDGITVPTQAGEITVLPGHIPLVSSLKPGMITLHLE
ncbi:F0F1 ATP synthase subunit epsilon, partial [Patescibacteria group bacterium]|nr:F0F1 ATP synthase subunit epsilon [Patescibacteria group bacterium]